MRLKFAIKGTAPLIVQSDRLVNPLDEIKKALGKVTSKRKKTDEDELEIYRLQFYGSLYYDAEIGPYVPAEWLTASLRDGGRRNREGKNVVHAVLVTTPFIPIEYHGPRKIDELWANPDYRFLKAVKQQQARVMRCRPWFRKWELHAEGELQTDLMDFAILKAIADEAGLYAGLGGWRPSAPKSPGTYGRYQIEVSRV